MRVRHFLALGAVTLFVAFGPPERTSPTKWAVVIGISDYTNFGDEIGGDLPGAGNDARAVADVLVNRYGFGPDNVKLILDGEATRDRMTAEMTEWLPSVARPGDLIWFYFAGHGSQAWDLDGDEEDGLDETICPADVMRGNTERDILDDEMGGWLRQLPTDNVIVVWDKCHAKSSTRAVTPFSRPRSLNRNAQQDVAEPANRPPSPEQDAEAPSPTGILEIAAAQADEVAIDAAFRNNQSGETTFGGAFTTPFVKNLWNAPEDATYREIFSQTKSEMHRNRYRQQPDIDEKPLADRPLFWIEPAAAPAPVAAAPEPVGEAVPEPRVGGLARVLELPSETEAVLAGGFSADMTVRSIYQAGNDFLLIEEVEPEQARATVTTRETRGFSVATEELRVGGRARLVAYRYPEAMLRVMVADLPQPARATLRDELMSVPSLMLIETTDAFSHLIVRPRSGHYVVLSLDGFPRDSVPAPDPEFAAKALAGLLKQEFGQFQLAELNNPAMPFEVDFRFGNGRNDFRLDEQVSFVITSERDGYLTLVDLAADGTASVLFPQSDSDNKIFAGREKVVSGIGGQPFIAVPPTGRGIVRVFVTERPMIMPFGLGADATEAQKVWQSLRTAAGQPPIAGSDAIPVQNWATAVIPYEIRP